MLALLRDCTYNLASATGAFEPRSQPEPTRITPQRPKRALKNGQEFHKFFPRAAMALETQLLYEFDGFRLNPADHSLLCAGKPISLTPKTFDILVTLIEKNGQLVTKDELMRKIWPDSFVEEANLTVNVSALRKALGDSPENQQYIETVPKLGYRFTARVTTRNENPPSLTVIGPGSAEIGP